MKRNIKRSMPSRLREYTPGGNFVFISSLVAKVCSVRVSFILTRFLLQSVPVLIRLCFALISTPVIAAIHRRCYPHHTFLPLFRCRYSQSPFALRVTNSHWGHTVTCIPISRSMSFTALRTSSGTILAPQCALNASTLGSKMVLYA